MNYDSYLKTANELADLAGEIARKFFRADIEIALKKPKSAVTEADLTIEKKIRERLAELYPKHGVYGEEYASTASDSEYTWVIDPIDGTAAFTCGKPTFCTLIALLKNDEPVLGVIDQPITHERWSAVAGGKMLFNGAPYLPPKYAGDFVRFSTTSPKYFKDDKQAAYQAVLERADVVSYSGDGYAYALLAHGCIDVILETGMHYYDIAAAIPVIQAAGGVVTDWQGRPISRANFTRDVLATRSAALHKEILKLL